MVDDQPPGYSLLLLLKEKGWKSVFGDSSTLKHKGFFDSLLWKLENQGRDIYQWPK